MSKEMWNKRTVVLSVKCNICKKVYAVYVTPESYEEYCSPNRRLIQEVFPYLTPSERELLISNTCDTCWNAMFPDEDEDDEELFAEGESHMSVSDEDRARWDELLDSLCGL